MYASMKVIERILSQILRKPTFIRLFTFLTRFWSRLKMLLEFWDHILKKKKELENETKFDHRLTFFEGLICWSCRKYVNHICNTWLKAAVCSWTSFIKSKDISKIVFKGMQCFLYFSVWEHHTDISKVILDNTDSQIIQNIFTGKCTIK